MNKEFNEVANAILTKYDVRNSHKEKDDFLAYYKKELIKLGYREDEIKIEIGKNRNLVVGNPTAENIFVAHYDTPMNQVLMLFVNPVLGQALGSWAIIIPVVVITNFIPAPFSLILLIIIFLGAFLFKNKHNHNDNTSGVIGVYNIAARVVNNPTLRSKCAFILFDNEEKMLLGSKEHKNKYPGSKNSRVYNLDCIGVGEKLLLAVTKKHDWWHEMGTFMCNEGFDVVKKKSTMTFLSDHAHFQKSIYFAYATKSTIGFLYLPNIHTNRDKICNLENVDKLASSLYKYISEEK